MALGFFKSRALAKPSVQEFKVQLFNTLHGKKETFSPIKLGRIGMYHCGPTVYGPTHIGHARPYIFADLLKRLFLYQGFKVTQVINITDVGHLTDDNDEGNDKIEEGAKRENKTAVEISKLYTEDFFDNLKKLNVDSENTYFPKATEHILEQVAFIKTLEEKGYTYNTTEGVYFDTSLFKNYGTLGKINLKGLQEGARVEVNKEKKNPTDFALWKFSKPEEKRQQEWESPWGKGFPGWHIECSAMSTKYLGHHFDIHTGGIDHIPTHHQNEIAQSEAAFGKPFVNYWLHVEHLMIDGKKISKSLGNFILLKQLEEREISPLAYRYWLLTSHYRTQINFTWEAVEAAQRAYFKLLRFFTEELGEKSGIIADEYQKEFREAIFDDLDTPKAVASLWNLVRDSKVSNPDKKATLLDFDRILGLNLLKAQEFLEKGGKILKVSDLPDSVKTLVSEREEARTRGDFAKADELREQIKIAGFTVTDTEKGTQLQSI